MTHSKTVPRSGPRSQRRDTEEDQTYCVGIGVGKSGTTWLYSYLLSHPDCRMSVLKEMSYFNNVGLGGLEAISHKIEQGRHDAARLRDSGGNQINRYTFDEQRDLLDDYEALVTRNKIDVPAYLEILRRHARSARVFGEVSPGYSVLTTDRFRSVYEAFPRTRVIYLMRDPLQRLWSHARMIGSWHAGAERQVALAETAAAIIGRNAHLAAICSYADTIRNLEAAVPRAHIHYEFYDVLFSGTRAATDARNRICDFLGIARHDPEDVGQVVNGGIPMKMPLGLGRAALSWLRPHYDFARAKFGAIPPAWEASLAEYG